MKKITIFLCCVISIICFVGCGNSPTKIMGNNLSKCTSKLEQTINNLDALSINEVVIEDISPIDLNSSNNLDSNCQDGQCKNVGFFPYVISTSQSILQRSLYLEEDNIDKEFTFNDNFYRNTLPYNNDYAKNLTTKNINAYYEKIRGLYNSCASCICSNSQYIDTTNECKSLISQCKVIKELTNKDKATLSKEEIDYCNKCLDNVKSATKCLNECKSDLGVLTKNIKPLKVNYSANVENCITCYNSMENCLEKRINNLNICSDNLRDIVNTVSSNIMKNGEDVSKVIENNSTKIITKTNENTENESNNINKNLQNENNNVNEDVENKEYVIHRIPNTTIEENVQNKENLNNSNSNPSYNNENGYNNMVNNPSLLQRDNAIRNEGIANNGAYNSNNYYNNGIMGGGFRRLAYNIDTYSLFPRNIDTYQRIYTNIDSYGKNYVKNKNNYVENNNQNNNNNSNDVIFEENTQRNTQIENKEPENIITNDNSLIEKTNYDNEIMLINNQPSLNGFEIVDGVYREKTNNNSNNDEQEDNLKMLNKMENSSIQNNEKDTLLNENDLTTSPLIKDISAPIPSPYDPKEMDEMNEKLGINNYKKDNDINEDLQEDVKQEINKESGENETENLDSLPNENNYNEWFSQDNEIN